jgi:GTP-binding protein HflX
VLLAAVDRDEREGWSAEDSIEELAQLASTAGARVVGQVLQRRERPDSARYFGKGKLEEIVGLKEDAGYNAVIFDDELTPTQQRNLEKVLGVKVLDRTALILDIFAQRARTREGQLQVELAQSEYLLPRLAGQWSHLERLGGGIGTRGPGESQIETDRRLARGRIAHLKREIEHVRSHRRQHRDRRRRDGMPVAALVGYTNAGKSTLLNALATAGVVAEDKLFATLDPTTRRIKLPAVGEALLTDTVGFIQKLPTSLVAAFRATLEELADADVLVHVVDVSHPNAQEQRATVEAVLDELGVRGKPTLIAFNKVDQLIGSPQDVEMALADASRGLRVREEGGTLVSAARGWGLEALLRALEDTLTAQWPLLDLLIPYEHQRLVRLARARGKLLVEEHVQDGTRIRGRIPPDLAASLREAAAPAA